MKNIIFLSLAFVFIFNACNEIEESQFSRLDLEEITISKLHDNYKDGKYTARQVVEAYLERIDKYDKNGPKINSIITLNPDALSISDSLDEVLKSGGDLMPLHGVTVVLKDNIDTKDKMPNTAGSVVMHKSMPLQDSYIVTKLRENGAIILGKANLSEWANFHSDISSSGWSALGGQTKNPYDITRTTCGSSSGSGAAVSANFSMLTVGTETNGSIVCPASVNGIVGIKPTVGLLSRAGIIPIAETQDTPGPLAQNVTDAAIMLGAMTGIDERDDRTKNSAAHTETDYTQYLVENALEGKRLGLYMPPMGRNHRVDSLMNETVDLLKEQGATIIEIDRIVSSNIERDSYIVLLYEFKAGVNQYLKSLGDNAPAKDLEEIVSKTLNSKREMKFDHNIMVKAQETGDLSDKEYQDALSNMLKANRENGIDKVMKDYKLDAFIGVSGSPAWKIDHLNGDNHSISSSSPAARAGYPAISVPMGYIDGLPVGISFFSKAWDEPELIKLAYSFEQITQTRKPPKFKTNEF